MATDREALVIFELRDDGGASEVERHRHQRAKAARHVVALAVAGDTIFVAERAGSGALLRLAMLEHVDGRWVARREAITPESHHEFGRALVANENTVAYTVARERCGPSTIVVHRRVDGRWVPWASHECKVPVRHLALDGPGRRLVWGSSEKGIAGVLAIQTRRLVEQAQLCPTKRTSVFGQGVAFAGDETIVGSKQGAHRFDAEGHELGLLRLARSKDDWSREGLAADDGWLVMTSASKGKGTLNAGTIAFYGRGPKGWRKLAERPGSMTGIMGKHSHGNFASAGRHVLLGFSSRFGDLGCVEHLYLPDE